MASASWPSGAVQPEALGWTEQDLFGLHRPPDKPAAGYSRLARYDATGLVWLLRGRRVCALTLKRSAAIKNRTSGTVTHFRPREDMSPCKGDQIEIMTEAHLTRLTRPARQRPNACVCTGYGGATGYAVS